MKLSSLARLPIKLYSLLVSPLLGQNCRYVPSCSCYMDQALQKHGVLKGFLLGTSRIFRCHPWSKHNLHDPVPERFAWNDMIGYKRSRDKKQQHRHKSQKQEF